MSQIPPKIIYILDTNVLLGFDLWQPISFSGDFWNKLEKALKEGRWILLDVVVKEIKYHNRELTAWCKKQKSDGLVSEIIDDNRNRAIEINNEYPMIDELSYKSQVDTYIIAYAEENGLGVFSRESKRTSTHKPHKIPDVCEKLSIKNIKVPIKFFKEINFK